MTRNLGSIIDTNCSDCLFVKEFPNSKLSLGVYVISFVLPERKSNKGKLIEWQDIAFDFALGVFLSVYQVSENCQGSAEIVFGKLFLRQET